MCMFKRVNETISDYEKSKKRAADIQKANRLRREQFAKSFRENQERIDSVRERIDNYSK